MGFMLANADRFVEKINRGQEFVSWGLDNMEIERWYDYTDFSPIHNACIRSKVDNGVGRGFKTDYKINNKQKDNVRRIIDEKKTPEHVEEHVNLMAYDNRNKVMETHKNNRKNKSIE